VLAEITSVAVVFLKRDAGAHAPRRLGRGAARPMISHKPAAADGLGDAVGVDAELPEQIAALLVVDLAWQLLGG
jgi:hypothetical protein